MAFGLFCSTIIGLMFAALLIFGGYRLFLFLLPIWGFFAGFAIGAHAIASLFGGGLFATVTSWVVGFVVALVFALASYFFYAAAVAVAAGTLGYMLGVGIMDLFGLSGLSFITFIIAIVLAAAAVVVTFRFNLQKYVIIALTAIGGAALAVGTMVLGAPFADTGITILRLAEHPVRLLWQTSPLMAILFVVLAIAGIATQIRANRRFEVDTYNRLATD